MKHFPLALACLAFAGTCLAADPAIPIESDDPVREGRWQELYKLMRTFPETDHKADGRKNSIERDAIYRNLRMRGLEFWDAYPQDARRYTWFNAMENRGFVPNYKYLKLDFDAEELRNWRQRRPAMRAEFLASPQVTADQRVLFRYHELRFDVLVVTGMCSLGRDLNPETAAKLTLDSVVTDILDYADTHPAPVECTNPRVKVGRYPVDLMNLLVATHLRGETPESRAVREGIARRMLESKLPLMRQYAEQSIATWGKEQIAVAGRTLTGENFDIADHRGKLVLIDCWATWCAPCIDEMPELRKFAERFGAQGLQILGISLDPAANKEKVMGILQKAGATWPQIAEGNEISRRLGCRSVPHVVLVGPDGRVIASGSFRLRELEKLIEENLAPTPAKAGS